MSLHALHVLPSLDPTDGGVPAVAVHANIAKRRAGIKVTVAFVDKGDAGPMREQLCEAGIATFAFPVLPRNVVLMRRWSVSPSLAWWLVRNVRCFDIVHVDGAWGLPGVFTVLLAKVARRPVVLSPHEALTTFDVDAAPTRGRRAIKAVLKRYYLRFADLIVFSSKLEEVDSIAAAMLAQTVVIPHPVLDDSNPGQARKPADNRRVVGFLGRLHPKKNLDLLIRALAALPDDVRLVIGGDGPPDFANGLRSLAAELRVSDRISWRGFLAPPARQQFFVDVDVVAMPSAYECFGMVGAEALSAGVPIVASDRTGLAEIIESQGGGLICRGGVDDIARSLLTLLNERRAGRSEEARRVAESSLSYSSYGRAMRNSYEALL